MKFNDKQSVYSQIATNIKRQIYNGEVALGSALPSVRSMASEYQVTIKTIQNTVVSLEEEGIIVKKAGVGTFVSDDRKVINSSKEKYINELRVDFFEGMKSIGINEDEAIKYILGGDKND